MQLRHAEVREAEVREPIGLHKPEEHMPVDVILCDGCRVLFELQLGEECAHVAHRPVIQGLSCSLLPQPRAVIVSPILRRTAPRVRYIYPGAQVYSQAVGGGRTNVRRGREIDGR